MKFYYLALLFCFSPIVQVKATTPKSVTCTRTEYREEYIPGTKSNPGYVKSYEVDVEVPCGGRSKAEKIDDNDCSEGTVIGGLLGERLRTSWGCLAASGSGLLRSAVLEGISHLLSRVLKRCQVKCPI